MDDRFEHENDNILKYLMDQQQFQQMEVDENQFELVITEESPEDIEYNINLLLGDLIKKVETVLQVNEDYSNKLKAHNQYGLFNMKNIIEDFEIDDSIYDQLTFRESLLVSKVERSKGRARNKGRNIEHPEPMGGMCIDVQKGSGSQPFKREEPKIDLKMMDAIIHHGEGYNVSHDNPRLVLEDDLGTQHRREMSKMLVHVSSDFDYKSNNGGSRITTWLDRNLHTLEELRREYLMMNKNLLEEKLLLTFLKPYKYYVKHKDFTTKLDHRRMYMLSKMKDYISEGTNFVLMRYIAIKRYTGTFELSCMYINGDMCRNIYECLGPEGGLVNNNRIDVCKINRTIIEECGVVHKCKTILTLNGLIVKQEWDNSDYILHMNPLLKITNDTPPGNDQVLLQDFWVNDMQLMSKYLDDKVTSQIKMNSYLLDHPEIKKLVADFIQEIIMRKPYDIIEYTVEHFLFFSPEHLPRYDYTN